MISKYHRIIEFYDSTIFWPLVKNIPKCWFFFQVISCEQSHKIIAKLASFVLLASLSFSSFGEAWRQSAVLWIDFSSFNTCPEKRSVKMNKTTFAFLKALFYFLRITTGSTPSQRPFSSVSHIDLCGFYPVNWAER